MNKKKGHPKKQGVSSFFHVSLTLSYGSVCGTLLNIIQQKAVGLFG